MKNYQLALSEFIFYSDLFLKIYLSLRKLISNFFYIPDISFLAYKTKYEIKLIMKELNFKFKKI